MGVDAQAVSLEKFTRKLNKKLKRLNKSFNSILDCSGSVLVEYVGDGDQEN